VVDDLDDEGKPRIVKARELAGCNGFLFRRNSLTGAMEAVRRQGVGVDLNAALHEA
jgi:2,3,4,5-tetrahydropyridine-2-carboxylate N-succinyltransferase